MRNKSIRTYYIKVIAGISACLLFVLASAYWYSASLFEKRSHELAEQSEKAETISELSDSISSLFFRSRGFYAFKLETELDEAYAELDHIREVNRQFTAMPLTKKETEFANEISGFLSNYESTIFPQAVQYVEDDDYESLRTLSSSGTNLSVNQFIKYADRYEDQAEEERDELYAKTERQVNELYLTILAMGLGALLFLAILSWRVVRSLISPIESMTDATDRYLAEQDVNYVPERRNDEIGSLSRSFAGMMETIQVKEQELLAQNEELLSQQEELFNRQRQLEDALSEARYAKIRLERYNGLSHKISFSDDIQEIAEATLAYLDTLFVIDKGIIYVPSNDLHVLHGIPSDKYTTYGEGFTETELERFKTEPYFQHERVLEDGSVIYDLFAAPQIADNPFKTLFVLSRSSRAFNLEDQSDLFGLAGRLALAIDRIDQHETISRERQLNQTILDNLEEGILFISAEGKPVQVNRALSLLLGQSRKTLMQSDWAETLAGLSEVPEDLETFLSQTLATKSVGLAETVYSIEKETKRVVSLYGTPVYYEEKRIGTLFVHRDITQAFEIDRMKTELVSTVSHELRTPLSSILGFTELLIEKEMDASRRSRYLDAIYKETKRLAVLINDFLDVQRMESGKQAYTMESVDVMTIAEQTIQNFGVQSNHSIVLEPLTERTICLADSARLFQVFTNLLSNAIKFSPGGGKVTISLAEQDDKLHVTIADQGIGIPQEELKHMFEKFYRFDNTYTRKIGGTGLGLAICQKIIETHGGQISIDSVENEGTTVRFTLPFSPEFD